MNQTRKIIFITTAVLIVGLVFVWLNIDRPSIEEGSLEMLELEKHDIVLPTQEELEVDADVEVNVAESTAVEISTPGEIVDDESEDGGSESEGDTSEYRPLPKSFDLEPAFAPQAPFADWGAPYQEACEEASMIIVAKYFHQQELNNQIMDEEIKKLVDWEIEKFGYYEHTTAEEVKQILEEYFNLKAEVTDEVTVDRIKQELFSGHLIIAPCAGRDLPNPYFKQPGPIYHMLVIRGWNKSEFITNDPGTKRGEGFEYKYEDLINNIHNPPVSGAEELTEELMRQGERVMIVVGR